MTETTSAPGPVGAARPIYRDPDDDMFAGVCAAVARYTDTDPVIWRIAAVVLTIFGGTGVALYVLGWVLIPKLGEDRSIAESWLRRRDGRMTAKTVALAAVAIIIVVGGLSDGRGVAAAAVLAGIGYLVYRERQGRPLAPAYLPAASDPVTGPPPVPAWSAPPPPMVRVPRERSRLGLTTVSLTALVSGILVWSSLDGADALTPGRITAIALMMIGAGLVIGTWFGRARWLVAVGLLLSIAVGGAFAADAAGATLKGGVGERSWVVGQGGAEQSYTLGVGEARLDLTQLPADGSHLVVHAKVSLGHLVVIVPDDVPIRVHAKLRIGQISEFGSSLVNGNGTLERTRTYGPAGDPRVEVEATMGTGEIEVQHG